MALSGLTQLLRSMRPRRNGGIYVYCSLPADADLAGFEVLATFREREGLSVIANEGVALAAGWPVLFRAAWITLEVNSALAAVGFTAAFAKALGDAGISCNVVAAVHHDHVFVPVERADEALQCLHALQLASSRT